MEKTYLGDSVYAESWDGDGIVLTTDNGMGPTNTIYMERSVLQALDLLRGMVKEVSDEEH